MCVKVAGRVRWQWRVMIGWERHGYGLGDGGGGGLGRGDGTLGGLGVAGEKVVANMVR